MTFGDDVKDWCEGARQQTNGVVRKIGIDIFSSIVKKTPVDEGRARGNWFATIDSPSTATTTQTDNNGDATIGREVGNILSFDVLKNSAIYITNNLPYIGKLEYGGYPNPPMKGSWDKRQKKYVIKSAGGYSKQEPAGMVRVTLAEADGIINKAVRS